MLSTSLFDYTLPEELIAQYPTERRDGSRMMVLDRRSGAFKILPFPAIRDYLEAGDALIYNDTRVLRGRMYARRDGDPAGAKFELLLVEALDPERRRWNVLLRPGRRARCGTRAVLLDHSGELNADGDSFTVEGRNSDGSFRVEFSSADSDRLQMRYGHIPLPPYISRGDETADSERYQTVYAEKAGAVAAPTAGLHFTPELLERIRAKGVTIVPVTLHVGLGTFRPVQVEDVDKHVMHSEWYQVTEEAANTLNAIRASGGRLICVGTTSVRTIETVATEDGIVHPGAGDTAIFIYPGKKIKAVDALITNFHLPQSTLLMLVSTFMGRETALDVYREAVQKKYRFFSFGDAMFIE